MSACLSSKQRRNHSLHHDGIERRLGITGQQFPEIDRADKLTLLVLHVDIVNDIEIARFTPQSLKGFFDSQQAAERKNWWS